MIEYLYDGLNVIIERDVTDATVASYVRRPDYVGGIGGIVSAIRQNTDIDHGQTESMVSNYYHYDGLGSVTDLTSEPGGRIAGYDYDAFGNILEETRYNNLANPHRFSTKEYSDVSDLIYFGARYYDPGTECCHF